jgi:hypothetical protein
VILYSKNINDYSIFFLDNDDINILVFLEIFLGNEGVGMVSHLKLFLHSAQQFHLSSFQRQ